jgi:hypothetical protein
VFNGDNSRTIALRQIKFGQVEKSWMYQQVLFELLFCLTTLLSMAMVKNFEVVLRQMLNHCV